MGKHRLLLLLAHLAVGACMCPFIHGDGRGSAPPVLSDMMHQKIGQPQAEAQKGYATALAALDINAVKIDLKKLFKDSQDSWPADYGNYAPFFVRLAWHCSGSYRTTDGRGGCAGGRQRFDPERSWDDNTNLDKARGLLFPIKEKYGLGLSWGDLFILAGTTAVESMGGPTLGFCAGRVDEMDGKWSQDLGPTTEQELLDPCPVNGECKKPLGSTTVGLIYLNPEGPMGKPIPELSSVDVRDAFGRMAMNDTETVALIGGGHAFGKTHGACPKGAGPSPKEDPVHPWPGKCGTGKGSDAFTSGFEGPWTTNPTYWDNQYFRNLVEHEWEVFVGPGGHHMWHIKTDTPHRAPVAPSPQGNGTQDLMMLTSDISLTRDPTGGYQPIVKEFARDQAKFDDAFAHAWYKLTTRDMGPVTRCTGPLVPPAQPWQNPLPPPVDPSALANFTVAADLIRGLIKAAPGSPSKESAAAQLVRLAWQCASTFRVTDFQGGCNGARIRDARQSAWPANREMDRALLLLKPVKDHFASHSGRDGDEGVLSWADLIVLAGTVAAEEASASGASGESTDKLQLSFCGGRTDADSGVRSDDYLTSTVSAALDRAWGNSSTPTTTRILHLKDMFAVMGVTSREAVALMGARYAMPFSAVYGGDGAWKDGTPVPTLDNSYFRNLLGEEWEEEGLAPNLIRYKAKGKYMFLLPSDLLLRYDPELAGAATDFAASNTVFLKEFASAWTKLMNADRFDGPTGNLCR